MAGSEGHVVRQAHLAAAQVELGQLHHLLDDGRHVRPLAARLAALDEAADALDDLAGALGLARGLLQRAQQLVLVDLPAADARDHAGAVVGDGRQRLVQLVRHAGGHLAHGDQAAGGLGALGLGGACSSAWRRAVMSVAITICARRPSTQLR
jgi:hypothetical protein